MPHPAWETLCLLAPLTTSPSTHLPLLLCVYLHPLSSYKANPIPGAVRPPLNIKVLGVLNMLEGRFPRSISEVEGVVALRSDLCLSYTPKRSCHFPTRLGRRSLRPQAIPSRLGSHSWSHQTNPGKAAMWEW